MDKLRDIQAEQRRQLKSALKWSLGRSADWKPHTNKYGQIREWFVKKLAGLISYSMAHPEFVFPMRLLSAVRLHYAQSRPISEIAEVFGYKDEKRLADEMSGVLDYVIKEAPVDILMELCPKAFANWRLDSCPQCKANGFRGDLYFDATDYGRWVCLQCSSHFDNDLNQIGGWHPSQRGGK